MITEEKTDGPPDVITSTLVYRSVAPEAMYKKAVELGIGEQPHNYWIARLYLSLPLPPCWTVRKQKNKKDIYKNTEFNVNIGYHPGSNFMQELIYKQSKKQPVKKLRHLEMDFVDKDKR
jgi:hypothetical protein